MTLAELEAYDRGVVPERHPHPPPPPLAPPQPTLAVLEVRIPVEWGGDLPVWHQYPLFSALSHLCPWVHADPQIRVGGIEGCEVVKGRLRYARGAHLLLRAPEAKAWLLAQHLGGEQIRVSGVRLDLGVPSVEPVVLAPRLWCRGVFISISHRTRAPADWMEFAARMGRQLDDLKISRDAVLHPGRRQVVRMKGGTTVGYAVGFTNLHREDALALMHHGLGGRRHQGGGFALRGELPPALHLDLEEDMQRGAPNRLPCDDPIWRFLR